MSVKKRGLGRNISALLGGDVAQAALVMNEPEQVQKVQQLSVKLLKSGVNQPRQDMDPHALQELSDSIKAQGILQPIIVRAVDDSIYEIIAGERRWRAAKLAGLTAVPVIIKNVDDNVAAALALIENMQRQDLNPIEEAVGIGRLLERYEMTHLQIAQALGYSRTKITNLLRLLKLPEEVKVHLARGDIEMGHARALLVLDDEQQLRAVKIIIEKDLSVRATESLVKSIQINKFNHNIAEKTPALSSQIELHLADILQAKVVVQQNEKGRGKVVIQYKNVEQLNKILSHIS